MLWMFCLTFVDGASQRVDGWSQRVDEMSHSCHGSVSDVSQRLLLALFVD